MRTIQEVNKKVRLLKAKLMKKKVCENFGDKEKRALKEYMGCVYSYPYLMREEIIRIIESFDNWCMNREGR
jgi:hypothetical protein